MFLLDALAEKCIADALERGEFSGLPGAGKPIALDDDPLIPEDMRAALRILKNAGFLPPELGDRAEIDRLEALLAGAGDDTERKRAALRIALLRERLSAAGRDGRMDARYLGRLTERFLRR